MKASPAPVSGSSPASRSARSSASMPALNEPATQFAYATPRDAVSTRPGSPAGRLAPRNSSRPSRSRPLCMSDPA